MIFKNLFSNLWTYSKPFFIAVVLIIAIQLYYNFQFARLALLVDNQKTVPHPIAFEAFPFVVYNMYSGKIDDWNKYSYLKIEADGNEVALTDLAVIQEDQFVNPSQKFLALQSQNFNDLPLYSYLNYAFADSIAARNIYPKVSNNKFSNNEMQWQQWLKRYLSTTLRREIKSVKIYDCVCVYDERGKPIVAEQKPLYQFE